MINFDEAKTLHEALSYDSMLGRPKARLRASVAQLASTLDQAIETLGNVQIIVIPWAHAMPFQRHWESVPAIRATGGVVDQWLWGYFITYRGIDCLASSLVREVWVSSIRDLRKVYGVDDQVVLIDVTPG